MQFYTLASNTAASGFHDDRPRMNPVAKSADINRIADFRFLRARRTGDQPAVCSALLCMSAATGAAVAFLAPFTSARVLLTYLIVNRAADVPQLPTSTCPRRRSVGM